MTKPCPNCGCVRPNEREQRYHNYRCGNLNYSILGLGNEKGWAFAVVLGSGYAISHVTGWPFLASLAVAAGLLAGLYGLGMWQDRQYKLGKHD